MKYKLEKDETREIDGRKVFRIYAAADFITIDGLTVPAGTRGGWVESENNLSQDGSCWVAGEAAVYGKARVSDDAFVCGNARVSGNAEIYDAACIYGNALVTGDARIREGAAVLDDARVTGASWLTDNARVCGEAVAENAQIGGSVIVSGDMRVTCSAERGGWLRSSETRDNSWLVSRLEKAGEV